MALQVNFSSSSLGFLHFPLIFVLCYFNNVGKTCKGPEFRYFIWFLNLGATVYIFHECNLLKQALINPSVSVSGWFLYLQGLNYHTNLSDSQLWVSSLGHSLIYQMCNLKCSLGVSIKSILSLKFQLNSLFLSQSKCIHSSCILYFYPWHYHSGSIHGTTSCPNL